MVASLSQAVFASARIYSIYQKELKYGVLIFVLYVIPVGLRLFNAIHVEYIPESVGGVDLGCNQVTSTYLQYHGLTSCLEVRGECINKVEELLTVSLVTISMNVFQIIADVTAIFLTVRRSLHIRENTLLFQGTFRTTDFLVQDGSILIGILLLVNIAQAIIVLVSPIDYLDIVSWQVSCILQCHWIFQLRQVLLSDDDTTSLGSMSSVRFANRLMGNIGAPLRHIGSSDLDSLDDESILFSSDPLSTMAIPDTPSDQETLLLNRQSSVDIEIDDLFEDEEYGKKVLGLIRRKGTTDTVDYHIVSLDATPNEKEPLVSDDESIHGPEQSLIP
ncbi:hypothetical protein NLI96_g6351 [Meripilus lineatus]|uniref:Uncharacterized protein n=1 Tax=Meripilus lineatus TaxID=2056292 RepID=A0AAD5V134_9APHY|nr:hypothetical protein NLI96_g6351 [Physisporinus lineatus]